MSHPVWVRGLKRAYLSEPLFRLAVAPRVGAWIETSQGYKDGNLVDGRTPCGCVD